MSGTAKKPVRLRHGVGCVRKIATLSDDVQSVLVTDGYAEGEVIVHLTANSFPAGLSPDQARVIARYLIEAADRVEKYKAVS